MITDKVHKKLVAHYGDEICQNWPESGVTHASYTDLAQNAELVLKAQEKRMSIIPQFIRVGSVVDAGYGEDNLFSAHKITYKNLKNKYTFPCLVEWRENTAVIFAAGVGATADKAQAIASSMAMRILISAGEENIEIRKVDFYTLGERLSCIPNQPKAPLIMDDEALSSYLNELRSMISKSSLASGQWRWAQVNQQIQNDAKPIQIVLISQWRDISDENKEIIKGLISNNVAARNGIYFFICCDVPPYKDDEEEARKLAYIMKLDEGEHRCYIKDVWIKGNIQYDLPSASTVSSIHTAYQKLLSGHLHDADGDGIWKGNSAKGVRAIMGTTPEGEHQFFELGIGKAYDAFHALIGGATGSGKSVLLREIICSLAERYSPEEVRMLLLDYKEGTEFAPFTKLPHVYALSIGSSAEFGLEVLKETQKEIMRRGQLFKDAGNAKNIEEYRKLTGKSLCRYILVADEFQVLLNDRRFGEEAKQVLNDLVRRGRAFGFNAILATQTLRDGALDGEAKNQFGCRIAMRMAESETDYFLASDNNVPASFNRKGQALVNYALGRKEGNIYFQSGNKTMPKKFRDTEDVASCLDMLHNKAVQEGRLPEDVYVYKGDGYACMPSVGIDYSAGALVGLRNNIQSTPVYLSKRQLGAKVLVAGGSDEKRSLVLESLAMQLSCVYGEPVLVQTTAEYLDSGITGQATVLNVAENDFDLEEAISEWKAARENTTNEATPTPVIAQMSDSSTFVAPEGMETDFAELMQSMQANNAALALGSISQVRKQNQREARDTRCLIVSIGSYADMKLLESAGMHVRDFRSIIYLDNVIYNQISGEFESGQLAESAAMLESPRGVVTKLRLLKMEKE